MGRKMDYDRSDRGVAGARVAGSERLKKTMDSNDPTRPYDETIKKEAMCINQSLSYLEQVRTIPTPSLHTLYPTLAHHSQPA